MMMVFTFDNTEGFTKRVKVKCQKISFPTATKNIIRYGAKFRIINPILEERILYIEFVNRQQSIIDQ